MPEETFTNLPLTVQQNIIKACVMYLSEKKYIYIRINMLPK